MLLFEEAIAATVLLSGIILGWTWLFVLGVVMLTLVFLLGHFIKARRRARNRAPQLTRSSRNPLIEPDKDHAWESEATFNPAAACVDGRIHLFYRALGSDGVSRIGHCSSEDGIHFDDRLPYPVFSPDIATDEHATHTSPARLAYDRALYASGGGWGGAEDPRSIIMDDCLHLTFSAFNGWDSIRMTHTSLPLHHLRQRAWRWSRPRFLSPARGKQKNWVLFPEKIGGRYAILHGLSPLRIDYLDDLADMNDEVRFPSAPDSGGGGYHDLSRTNHWDNIVRGAGAPPLRTPYGWILFYQALSPGDRSRYNVGVMLLDRDNPETILYRSSLPVLAPDMPYENDWKPGIVYASGAVIKDGTLFLYYGGGDKTVNVATAPIDTFLSELMKPIHAV